MKRDLLKVRTLNLKDAPQVGRPAHISSASGLVMDKDHFYVIADDELSLATFGLDGSPGELIPLFSGSLPLEPKARKKLKPDLEALLPLDQGLLAIPSGSTKSRSLGAFIKGRDVFSVDFSELYGRLREELPELNIEGAVNLGEELLLFQRGNGERHLNALVFVSLESVQKSILTGVPVAATGYRRMIIVNLGTLKSIPLSFTDAHRSETKKIWFLAVAERSDSTYLDGEYLGSVLGEILEEGVVLSTHELDCPQKPEGLVVDEKTQSFWVVTDADNSNEPSVLYQGQLDEKYRDSF